MSEDEAPVPAPSRIASLAPDLAILVLAAVVVFLGLGTRALWRQESRWAEIPREMILSGDYFHPSIGGDVYNDKPATSYWPVVLAARLTGKLDELAVRLPSAVAAIVMVWGTLWLGRRLWSRSTGRFAALMLLSCYGFLQWGRTGMPEMENAAAVLVAVCWYWGWRERPGFAAFLGFYLIVFVGALLKGLPAVVLPLIAIAPDLWSGDRWRKFLRPSHGLAAAIGLAVYLAPFVYGSFTSGGSLSNSGIALVFRENVIRFFRPFDHDSSQFYSYFYWLPFFFLPWTPLLLGGIAAFVWAGRELQPSSRWLAIASLLILVFFSISGSVRSYYVIPLLPFCALISAVFLTQLEQPRLSGLRRVTEAVQVAVIAGGILTQLAGPLVAGPIAARWNVSIPADIAYSMRRIGLSAGVAGAVVYLVARLGRGRTAALEAASISAAVLMGGFVVWQVNLFDAFRHERAFLRDVSQRTAQFPAGAVAFYRTTSDVMLFYVDRPVHPAVLRTEAALQAYLSSPGPRAVVTRRRFAADVAAHRGPPNVEEASPPWERTPNPDGYVGWVIRPGD